MLCLCLVCGCEIASRDADSRDGGAGATAQADKPELCAREGNDLVRDVFCQESRPKIQSLRDLQALLQIDRAQNSGSAYSEFVAVLGHSTALDGHQVSPINPRTIFLAGTTFVAFQRGAQRVEIAVRDVDRSVLNFYLLRFTQTCNEHAHGCSAGDLYTPRIESDWTDFDVQDDEQLKNTSSDCRQCHRRGRDSSILLMRELSAPWTHFFDTSAADIDKTTNTLPGVRGADLMRDYLAAKGDEAYGSVAMDTVTALALFTLQSSVDANQPALFDAPKIEDERWPYGANGYAKAPQPSPTWQHAYEAFKRGEQLAIPYLEQRATDPDKQAALTLAYQQYRAGELDADALPGLANIFPDDAHVRAQIGLQTEPDATAPEALIQACGSCHNDVLDQSLTRARFNIDLSRLDKPELDLAIERLERDSTVAGVMPPPEARQLAPKARTALLDLLHDSERALTPDPSLQHASKLGMAGGGPQPAH